MPGPKLGKAGALCFLLVLHLRFWGLVGLPLLLPGASSVLMSLFGGLGCGCEPSQNGRKKSDEFFLVLNGRVLPASPSLYHEEWNMYYNFVEWYRHVIEVRVEFSPLKLWKMMKQMTNSFVTVLNSISYTS